jgi:oligopeptide transport system substrate-binding protein
MASRALHAHRAARLNARAARRAAALLCVLLVGLAACDNKLHTPREAGAPSLVRGNEADPDTLDPQKTSTTYEANVLFDLFEGLMTLDAGARPIYGAAISHSVSADGLVWTFRLRDETWSDGVPLTADDFVFSFRRILNPKTAAKYASLLYPIKNAQAVNEGRLPREAVGVAAPDAKTVAITLERPTPYLLQLLTHITCMPVPEHVVEKAGDAWTKPGTMVTNGPYVLGEWIPNSHIRLTANPRYYDAGHVGYSSVTFLPISDDSIELKRYRAGEIDMTDSIPARELPVLKAEFGPAVHVSTYLDSDYILINVRNAPFTDARVREALSLAIDRETLAARVLNAGQTPAYSFVPPGIADYANHAELKFKSLSMVERRARAGALLTQAGFGPSHPLRFTLRYREAPDGRRIAVAAQAMWKEVGVEAQLLNSEGRVLSHALRTQDFEVARANWIADYDDAENFLFLFESRTGQMNYTKYSNPAYDALLARAAAIMDPAARADVLRQAEQLMLGEAPVIPLYFGAYRRLVRPGIAGYEDNVLNYHLTRFLHPGAGG